MRKKLVCWFLIIAAFGMVSAEERKSIIPDYLTGLQALTDKRIPMKQAAAARCSIDAILTRSPHSMADMVVHANQTLIDYIKKNPDGLDFPLRSVLLKEKFPAGNPDSSAILITRMERVAMTGAVEDWKFSATSLKDGKPAGKEETPSSCVVCHEDFEVTSFVSPDSVKLLSKFVREKP